MAKKTKRITSLGVISVGGKPSGVAAPEGPEGTPNHFAREFKVDAAAYAGMKEFAEWHCRGKGYVDVSGTAQVTRELFLDVLDCFTKRRPMGDPRSYAEFRAAELAAGAEASQVQSGAEPVSTGGN